MKSEQEDILDEQGRLLFTTELAASIVVMRKKEQKEQRDRTWASRFRVSPSQRRVGRREEAAWCSPVATWAAKGAGHSDILQLPIPSSVEQS